MTSTLFLLSFSFPHLPDRDSVHWFFHCDSVQNIFHFFGKFLMLGLFINSLLHFQALGVSLDIVLLSVSFNSIRIWWPILFGFSSCVGLLLVVIYFWHTVLPYILGWSQTPYSLASVSWVLGLQMHPATLYYFDGFLLFLLLF